MKIAKLIRELQVIKLIHGNVEVYCGEVISANIKVGTVEAIQERSGNYRVFLEEEHSV